jgi:hypothetical protein
VFVVLVIATIYVRSRLKSKRVLEAAANPRNMDVDEGEGSGDGAREEAVSVIPIPVPPRTPKRSGSRKGERRVSGESEEGIEMQRLSPGPDTISPETSRTSYQQTRLADSDMCSTRYMSSPHHSPSSKHIDHLRDGCSTKPLTLLPTLPPLSTPDIGSSWMLNLDSPAKHEND